MNRQSSGNSSYRNCSKIFDPHGDGFSTNRSPSEMVPKRCLTLALELARQEIGERLRTLLKDDRELPAILRSQIDRLRQLEGESQPNVAKPTTRWWARRPPTRS
jgi:hypothetical protein